jgi:hypothetical protein
MDGSENPVKFPDAAGPGMAVLVSTSFWKEAASPPVGRKNRTHINEINEKAKSLERTLMSYLPVGGEL